MANTEKIKLIFRKIILFFFCVFLFFIFSDSNEFFSKHGLPLNISITIALISLVLIFVYDLLFNKLKNLLTIFVPFGVSFLFLLLITLTNASFLNIYFNGYHSTNPILESLSEVIKYAVDFSIIIYILYCIRNFSFSYFKKYIQILSIAWLLIAFVQLFVFYSDNNQFNNIYDKLDFLGILVDSSHLEKYKGNGYRIYSFASEPAANAIFLCCFAIPFLLFYVKNDIADRKKFSLNYILLPLILIGAIFTKSTSVFVGMFVLFLCYIVSFYFGNSKTKYKIFVAVGFAVIVILIFSIPLFRDIFLNDFLGKIFGGSSYSAMYRYSTAFNDLLIFLKMPLFGCGDGMQGYFYFNNISNSWFSNSNETINSLLGKKGIINGGPFLPSFISGFGLIGNFILWKLLIKKYILLIKKIDSSFFKKTYIYSLAACLLMGSISFGFHLNCSLYLFLCIPYCNELIRPNENIQRIDQFCKRRISI